MELLAINNVSYPMGFNGLEWNTIDPLSPKKKNMEFYLKENLPNTKYSNIRHYMQKCTWHELPNYKFFEPYINSEC